MDPSSAAPDDDGSPGAPDSSSASFLPSSPPPTWQTAYVSVLLAAMILVLASDRLGSDAVTMTVLAALLVAPGIISLSEALEGFANSGLWSVMVLSVVTEAVHKTSALGWYMRRAVLGSPTSHAEAQLRLVIPVACVSAFLSNTPLVVLMVPIVQQWADASRLDVQQLLIPLSWATILGGTITAIGTSANLVVLGALDASTVPGNSGNSGNGSTNVTPAAPSMFELALYGIPNALVGLSYILLVSPFLLGRRNPQQQQELRLQQQTQGGIGPGRGNGGLGVGGGVGGGPDDPILLGARLTPWSPAAGRSVERSGLRDTGGIYLVSVVRAQTGHVHRAVSRDFILNVGDVLYFTGLVESFAAFCGEHGLELLTNETEDLNHDQDSASYAYEEEEEVQEEEAKQEEEGLEQGEEKNEIGDEDTAAAAGVVRRGNGNVNGSRDALEDDRLLAMDDVPVGVTKESLLRSNRSDRLRCLAYMTDLIRGYQPPTAEELLPLTTSSVVVRAIDPRPQIVVAGDDDNPHNDYEALVCVGINCFDRPGLILDISKTLQRLSLQFKNTEACVTGHRSVSIWRCRQVLTQRGLHSNNRGDSLEGEIWTALHTLLCPNTGVQVLKQRGLRVVRAQVTKNSRLLDKTASEVEFRAWYGAAIVAVQSAPPSHQAGSSLPSPISGSSPDLPSHRFREDDVLILQADDDSPLLQAPPDNIYNVDSGHLSNLPATSVPSSLVSLFGRNGTHHNASERGFVEDASQAAPIPAESEHGSIVIETVHFDVETGNDLYETPSETIRDEVRAAWNDLKVLSHHVSDGDPEAFGPRAAPEFLTAMRVSKKAGWTGKTARDVGLHNLQSLVLVSIERHMLGSASGSDAVESVRNERITLQSLHQDMPLEEGDILWFSGPASAIAGLRRIPGLESYEHDEVKKMNEKVHERRLVQAVVSRHGPLVGKTVKEMQFRTRYGAAVIAVQREGKRVHQLPGMIKLQAGDVLLLEAGPAFLGKNPQNDTSFSLLVEVKDSSPPRLRFLAPTMVIFVAAVAVYAAGVTSLFVSMLVASILLVFLGVISVQEARHSLNWDMYITVAAAFGISSGLVNSGVAGGYANFLVTIGNGVGLGDAGVIAGVYLSTVLLSNVLTNAAAAALLFPMALNAATQVGMSPTITAFTVMLGASASFVYPYGYSTNLLIYGPGKYKYTDFLLFGAPLQIILWISATTILSVDSWHLPWIVSWSIFLSAVTARVAFSFRKLPA